MSHLSPETFVDLLDGTLPETAVPHLGECDVCRRQLAELRVTWQAASEAEVPEPSPLFWEHLSARVHEAVAAEGQPRAPWWKLDWSWRPFGIAAAGLAAVVLAVWLRSPGAVAPQPVAPAETVAVVSDVVEALPPLDDDPSIGFVADLAGNLDLDTAMPELGLSPLGASERALSELDASERVELSRLLNEAMGTL